MDILLDNINNTDILTVGNSILYILADIFLYSWFKYLIAFKYYYPMDVLYISGIMNFIIHFISFSVVLLIQHLKDDNLLLSQFSEFYEELGIWPMLGRFFFGMVFVGFLVGINEFLILDKLAPNFVIISYAMGKIPSS